jgi:hypothetical protein
MSSFTNPLANFDTSSVFDKLKQAAASGKAIAEKVSTFFRSIDADASADAMVVATLQSDMAPVFYKRTTDASNTLLAATNKVNCHATNTLAYDAQFKKEKAARVEKLRLEHEQHDTYIRDENDRHKRRLATLNTEHDKALDDDSRMRAAQNAEKQELDNKVSTKQTLLREELQKQMYFMQIPLLLDNGPAGGAGGAGRIAAPSVTVTDVTDVVAGGDDDLEEGEIRDTGRPPKRDRDDDDAAGTASKQAKLD